MRFNVYIPLALSLLLAVLAPQLGRRVSPSLAVRVLVTAAVLTAVATTWAMVLLSATLVNESPPVVAEAREDGRSLSEPVPEIIGVGALLALALITYRVHRAVCTELVTRRALRRICNGHPADTELVVAASPVPQAFAIPAMSGSRGRILVTAAMLVALDPAERRVLLAHERAHLTHRHALMRTAVTLAAAANPALGSVGTTVAFLVERWADEQAATALGDRTVTARALAHAALIAHRAHAARALNFTDHAVTRRVTALQIAPPPFLWPLAAAVLALGLLPIFGAADATGDLLELLEHSLI